MKSLITTETVIIKNNKKKNREITKNKDLLILFDSGASGCVLKKNSLKNIGTSLELLLKSRKLKLEYLRSIER